MNANSILAALVAAALTSVAANASEDAQSLTRSLLDGGVMSADIRGVDPGGVPLMCATSRAPTESNSHFTASAVAAAADLPADERGWEAIPGVIRDDGSDDFYLEVEVHQPVTGVRLEIFDVQSLLSESGQGTVALRDDGLGDDRVNGDGIYVSERIRWNAERAMPAFYGGDPASPAGIAAVYVGEVVFEELDGTETEFLLDPEVGLVSAALAPPLMASLADDVVVSPHLVNVITDGRETQRALRSGGDLRLVTQPLYAVLPDAFDMLMLLSTNKVERAPRTSRSNFFAGIHLTVKVDYDGTGKSLVDVSATYGSGGRLIGINVLDAYSRGIQSNNAVHEIQHQWSAAIDPALGISDGSHYNQRSSAASLLGGFDWPDDGGGTRTLDCTEGRNGATNAPPFDLYTMGLVPASAVPSIGVDETILFNDDCDAPVVAGFELSIEEIMARHGPRVPGPAAARTAFRLGFVAESHGRPLTPTEMTFYDTLAAHFTSDVPGAAPDPYLGFNWVPVTRFYGNGTTWRSDVPAQAFADTDGDGVADALDNCTLVANANQVDFDNDGYGNICDADLNNDDFVNIFNLGLFRVAFSSGDLSVDFNGDGNVNIFDLGLFRTLFLRPPGPSGLVP